MEAALGLSWAEQSVEIHASPEACFAAITDYESFPRWQSAVVETEVLQRDTEGLAARVRTRSDAKFRVVSYVLDYHYERPEHIWWDFVEGDGVEAIEGEFRFDAIGSGTRATYRLGIDAGIPIPGLIARRLTGEVMRRSVTDLREEVARRSP